MFFTIIKARKSKKKKKNGETTIKFMIFLTSDKFSPLVIGY